MAKDLVCGTEVDAKTCKIISEFEKKKYYFCCNDCRHTFDLAPRNYIR